MCCDRSPAVFSQRYNFPREQAWRQLPLYMVVALAIRSDFDFACYAPPLGETRMSKRSKPRRLPFPLLRVVSTPHEGAGSCTFAEIDYLCSG